ncbi:MAG: thrombospondin type 3 repeat-containing protein, partial [Flavobacteriales bacterium]|nr:thrombospondin type 3 repeat-containing protein [Flavobacteriales bacterium]
MSAAVQVSPARITLTWPAFSGATSYTIYRKLKTDTGWGSVLGTVTGSATQFIDNGVTVGVYYEYRVVRSSSSGSGTGYIASGIQLPVVETRGKIILLVDNTLAPQLVPELAQLDTDLKADGWVVLRQDVSRTASSSSIRAIIQGFYNADPTQVKALYLVGHVPVPYSGNIAPDGHGEHQGAWPCDGYYAEMNSSWTDATVNNNTAQRVANRNIPGDGKFDQSDLPSAVELQVGRVDLADMPAFASNEVQLVRDYLNKAHAFKTRQTTPLNRGIVFDNLQWVSNPIAGGGYRSMAALFGAANITDCYPYGAGFSTFIHNQNYLWTYASGGGLQAYEGSTLTYNGADNVTTTQALATSVNHGGVFNMSCGSYFGDWDNTNNFLRAVIARGSALTNVWAGIPNWWFQHMAMGDPIGYSALVSMNNTNLYLPMNGGWQASIGRSHLGLMGDPSLRAYMVAPPQNLTVVDAAGTAQFAWTASSETVDGYFLYQFDAVTGAITRAWTNLITGTNFSNPAVPFIPGKQYMIRAVKLRTTASGSYYDLSLGAMGFAGGSPAPDCTGAIGGSALPTTPCNDGSPCTINDVWNASCQCIGTFSGDSDGDGICNAQDNCPFLAGQIGSPCNDGSACTINDVINSSCQCVGTYTGDTDGDGICNAIDNCPNTPGQVGSPCNDGDPCTLNDMLNSSCQCVGTYSGDPDGDGICSALDNCPTVPGQIGSACNDGNPCTTNDVLNSSCQCVGTPVPDSDGDGLCDAVDNCPGVAGQIGSPCNDGNAATINDALNASCQCVGTAVAIDCLGVPGGAALPGTACNDGNANTVNDQWTATCTCVGQLLDCMGVA